EGPSRSQEPPIERVARDGELPLSFAEARLWFLDQLEPGTATYNVPQTLSLKGALNLDALHSALSALVARHESLRTRFVAVDGEPRRIIDPPRVLDLRCVTAA